MLTPFTLIRDAEVFDPSPLGRRDVLACGEVIVAIGAGLDPPRGVACEVIEAGGRALVPGLVDAHVHVTGGGGESGFSSRVPPITLTALTMAGVTSCVGVLGTDVVTRTMEDLVARTLALREEGLSAWCWTGGYSVPPLTLTGSVRRDVIFVDPILGAGEIAISDHRSSQPTFDELVRLAADCHVAGLTSGKAGILHLHLGDGERGLELVRRAIEETELPPRVFHPTHVNRQPRLFEEARAIATRGVTVDVTSFPVEGDDPALSAEDAIGAWLDEKLPSERLTVSSDGCGCLPVFDEEGRLTSMDVGRASTLLDTIRALVGRGRGLEDALPFFTTNVAGLLRLPKKGRIAPGFHADLVLLDEDVRPIHVMARGRPVVRDSIPSTRGPFETEARGEQQ